MRRSLPAAVAALAVLLSCPPSWAVCVGDCNANSHVAVNELILGVNIALGHSALDLCSSCDANGNGSVAVGELIQAVNNALGGCADGPTATPTLPAITATATITQTPSNGPRIVFFGLSNADDSLASPSGEGPGGVPVYERPFGFSFSLVVEAVRGASGKSPGLETFVDGGIPDLQVQATRDLGDGSSAVCDVELPDNFGGVPGIDPPRLEEPAQIADALNDFGCRFVDGEGTSRGRACDAGCVRFESGQYGCAVGGPFAQQYCAPVPQPMGFPLGDTLVTARVRDADDNLGDPAQIIIRVSSP